MNKENYQKLNSVFILAIFALLAAGFICALFFPKLINEYENRYAERFNAFTLKSFMDGSFQDQTEKALGDPLAVLAANTGIIEASLYFPLAVICMFPVGKLFRKLEDSAMGVALLNSWHVLLLILCSIYLISNSYNPFIYFRF
ncbi:MAG: hypothetical protein IJM08_02815 [Firmicutes bacterium]|nr:hypothetical protein [Bacillota bacterium]